MAKDKDFDSRFEFKEWESYILHEDSSFDKYALEVAAEEQPALMTKWLDLLAQAISEASKAKEGLQNAEASLFLKGKMDGIPDMPKPTDTTVKHWVSLQPEYRKAQRRKRKADNNVAYLQNARSTLEHRKAMVKEVSNLWVCGYFAKPLVQSGAEMELDESAREATAEVLKEKLTKRKLR